MASLLENTSNKPTHELLSIIRIILHTYNVRTIISNHKLKPKVSTTSQLLFLQKSHISCIGKLEVLSELYRVARLHTFVKK